MQRIQDADVYSHIVIRHNKELDFVPADTMNVGTNLIGMIISVIPDEVRNDDQPALYVVFPNACGWTWADGRVTHIS